MKRLCLLLCVLLTGSACGGEQPPSGQREITTTKEAPPITDVSEIDDLKAAFNAKAGEPRLILLISPT